MSVNLRLDPEMHDELVRIAKDEERSLAGQIKLYLKRALEDRRAERVGDRQETGGESN